MPVCELGTVTGMADRWAQCRTHLLQLPLELLPDAHCQLTPHSQVKPIVFLSLGPLQPGSQCQPDCSYLPLRAHQFGPPASFTLLHAGPRPPLTWVPVALAPSTCSMLSDTALFILQRRRVSPGAPAPTPGKTPPALGLTVRVTGKMGAMEGS